MGISRISITQSRSGVRSPLLAHARPPEVARPNEQPLDLPAFLVAPQLAPFLGLRPLPTPPVRRTHLDALGRKRRTERVGVVRPIPDQPTGLLPRRSRPRAFSPTKGTVQSSTSSWTWEYPRGHTRSSRRPVLQSCSLPRGRVPLVNERVANRPCEDLDKLEEGSVGRCLVLSEKPRSGRYHTRYRWRPAAFRIKSVRPKAVKTIRSFSRS